MSGRAASLLRCSPAAETRSWRPERGSPAPLPGTSGRHDARAHTGGARPPAHTTRTRARPRTHRLHLVVSQTCTSPLSLPMDR